MSLPPLPTQEPAANETSNKPEPTVTVSGVSPVAAVIPEAQAVAKRYFWCSWPDFRVAKAGKPAFMFEGRYLETEDAEQADWILECFEKSAFPCEVKELTETEYMDGRFDQQVANSSSD